MAFTFVTVTRTYRSPAGFAAQGVVTFTPSNPMVNGTTTVASTEQVYLNNTGSISIVLAANNDPATTPVGTYYTVRESIVGQTARTYNVIIPYNAPGLTIDLATLAPVSTSAPAVQYVTSVNGQSGAVTVASATDATTSAKGIARILGGTADAPTVPWASVTGTPTLYTAENARDDLATALVAGSNITITPNDPGDTITIAASGLQPLATMLTRLAAAPVTLTYAASITPDASQSCAFYCTATGDLTLADISNGVAGQPVYIQITASGASRTLTVTGVGTYLIPSGQRWARTFRYDSALPGFVLT